MANKHAEFHILIFVQDIAFFPSESSHHSKLEEVPHAAPGCKDSYFMLKKFSVHHLEAV